MNITMNRKIFSQQWRKRRVHVGKFRMTWATWYELYGYGLIH